MSFAQHEGTVVFYYIHNNLGIRQESQLKFNKAESVLILRQDEKVWPTPQTQGETTTPRRYTDWFIDTKSNQIIKANHLKDGTTLYASYKPEPMEWEIQNETKTILGYKVQKAITKKHKHDAAHNTGTIEYGYAIAWFTIDLPISSGPDEFWGLPGLILELSFSERTLVNIAEKITFEQVGNIKPNQGIQVTKEQLEDPKKIDKKWLKNARELLNSEN